MAKWLNPFYKQYYAFGLTDAQWSSLVAKVTTQLQAMAVTNPILQASDLATFEALDPLLSNIQLLISVLKAAGVAEGI